MHLDIERHIVQCLSCAETKGTTQTAPILEYSLPARPFNVVGINLLQLPRSIKGSTYVPVCIDHFSCFTVLAPLPNKSATIVAHATVSYLICPYTTPGVLSDMGQNLRIRSFGISALNFTFNKHLLHLITLLQMASLNAPMGKSLRFGATLQDIYRKLGRIGFLRFLPLLMALSILPQTTHLTTSCKGLRNTYLMMWWCPLLFPCTP